MIDALMQRFSKWEADLPQGDSKQFQGRLSEVKVKRTTLVIALVIKRRSCRVVCVFWLKRYFRDTVVSQFSPLSPRFFSFSFKVMANSEIRALFAQSCINGIK